MKKYKHIPLLVVLWMTSSNLFAQAANQQDWMTEKFYASGKIYGVIAVISIVLVGMVVYLINLDRKLTRLEKEIEEDVK